MHGLLEVELFAGIVELGAGDLDGASACLRTAYDGLRRLGADADAARAGALLARVALERGDTDEAERLAGEAEQLAGDDLQAGISWRRVQAEVLARRGAHDAARTLAEAAVAIASRTDALVHHADACAALAAVRRAAGDVTGAMEAAREATELYERKGATALAAAAQSTLGDLAISPTIPLPPGARRLSNRCTEIYEQWAELFAARDWRGMTHVASESFELDDRRLVVGVGRHDVGAEALADARWFAAEASAARAIITPLAIRGEQLALVHSAYVAADGSETFNEDGLCVFELGGDDRLVAGVVFSAGDLDAAYDELDRRYLDGEGAASSAVVGALGALHRGVQPARLGSRARRVRTRRRARRSSAGLVARAGPRGHRAGAPRPVRAGRADDARVRRSRDERHAARCGRDIRSRCRRRSGGVDRPERRLPRRPRVRPARDVPARRDRGGACRVRPARGAERQRADEPCRRGVREVHGIVRPAGLGSDAERRRRRVRVRRSPAVAATARRGAGRAAVSPGGCQHG